MAAIYFQEEDLWKCKKHPSKRRRHAGVCPTCLRDRLLTLCPHCATPRPCPCPCPCLTSSSSSSSSSSSAAAAADPPTFRRSTSLVIPFLRSSNNFANPKTPSFPFLSGLKRNKKREEEKAAGENCRIEELSRSRSVNAKASAGKGGKFWQFPSPMKVVFRSAKTLQTASFRGSN